MFYRNGNPATVIRWTPPSQYTDGSPYTESDHKGYTLGILTNGQIEPFVDVPVALSGNSYPIADLGLPYGLSEIALRTVAANGTTSVWSATITVENRDERTPNAPMGFTTG